MTSITRRVAAAGVGVVALALLAVGVATGASIHVQRVHALDRDLLDAASSHGRGGVAHDGIATWEAVAGERRVQPRIHARALEGHGPLIKDLGEDRLLLLPRRDPGGDVLVAALARRVTLADSASPFAAGWVGASGVTLALAAALMSAAVRRALSPLDAARADVGRVMGVGELRRVSEAAPPEVRPLLVAVNALLDRLDAAHGAQVRFTADAAHELRTPVAAALGEIDVALRRERTAEEWRGALVSVREDVVRMQRIVDSLTALARLDRGEVAQDHEPVRASEIADGALSSEREALERAGCEVLVAIEADPELRAHVELVRLGVANLLRNAAQHAPGAEVALRVCADGGFVVFEVADRGPGLVGAPVLDRFARGDGAQLRAPGGLGLGLALAREVAVRHGGDCVLTPGPAGGVTARLRVRATG